MAVLTDNSSSVVQPLSRQPAPNLANLSTTAAQRRGGNLAAAILHIRSTIFNNEDGDRPGVPDVLVIVAHRVSKDPGASQAAAEHLKSDGIRIIGVGIGSHEVDRLKQELRAIATYSRESDRLLTLYYQTAVLPALVAETICAREFDAAEGSVRLADESAASGRLEMFVSGEWIAVCSSAAVWTRLNTDVACRELGFPAGLSSYTLNATMYTEPSDVAIVDNVTCAGNESRLVHCSHEPFSIVDSGCGNRRRQVFLICLCANCADYQAKDNRIRLQANADRTPPVRGRLQVFSFAHRWGGICRNGWTDSNTRVACRELGFINGAGTYDDNDDVERHSTLVLERVSCVGSESSLFDCNYHTMSTDDDNNCSMAVNVMCQCGACRERNVLRSPGVRTATVSSVVQFEWTLNNVSTGGDFEFWFLSSKNRRLVLRRTAGDELLIVANTELGKRVELIGDNKTRVGFRLSGVGRADMGVYALHAPHIKLFCSHAVLFVTDFALVPASEVRRQVHESLALSWDLTTLRQLRDIRWDISLTTPATGRLPIDYYYMHWLRDNPARRHSVPPQPPDYLCPTVVIDDVTVPDAGHYVVEVTLTSSVHRWLNSSWQFTTLLVVNVGSSSQSVAIITLAVLLAVMSVVAAALLLRAVYRSQNQSADKRQSSRRPQSMRYTTQNVDDGDNLSADYANDTNDNQNRPEVINIKEPDQPPVPQALLKSCQKRRLLFAAGVSTGANYS